MVVQAAIRFSGRQIADICRRFGVKRLVLFGSVLRSDFGAESDVDILYEFEPDARVELEILDLKDELSRIFGGRKIDLVPYKYISPFLRERVLAEARVVYGA